MLFRALICVAFVVTLNSAVVLFLWFGRPRRTKMIGRTQWLEEIARADDPPPDNVLRPTFVGKAAKELFGQTFRDPWEMTLKKQMAEEKEVCQEDAKQANKLK